MELVYYIGLTVLSISFSLRRDAISSKHVFFMVWIVAYIALAVVVRKNFDADINTYASAMSYNSMSIYYLREPVVWLGQRYLFSWLQDPFYVFIVTDLLAGILLFHTLKNFCLPQYAFFSILIFFPFVLGMQNVYRQWIATIIFLYCFSLIWNQIGKVKRYTTFLFAVMSHNVSAIFVPLLFIRKSKVIGKLMWYGSFLVAILGIWLGADTKSSRSTGIDLSLAYLFLFTFFISLVPFLDRGVFRNVRKLDYKLLGSLFVLSSLSIAFLSSAAAERVSMFCLLVAYPILVLLFEERFKQKFLIRALFSLLGFIPMLLFNVSKFIIGA